MRELVDYWLNGYDWRAQEAAMNALPQFRTMIDDVPVHFVHVKGKGPEGGPAPMPLVINHGWPWTFWDMRKIIGPLSDPGSAWRRSGRRLRGDRALAPRLCLFQPADHRGHVLQPNC